MLVGIVGIESLIKQIDAVTWVEDQREPIKTFKSTYFIFIWMSGLSLKFSRKKKWFFHWFSPVNTPELDISSSLDSSSSRGSINQGEFSKAATFTDIENFFSIYVDLNLTLERGVGKIKYIGIGMVDLAPGLLCRNCLLHFPAW